MRLVCIACAMLLVVAVSCTQDNRVSTEEPALEQAPPFDLSLPNDPPRQTSVAIVLTANGDEYYDKSTGATPSPPQMQLAAGSGCLEYAVYQLATSGHPLLGLEVTLEVTTGDQGWIGLPNYSRGTWELSGPYTTGTATFTPADPQWVSPYNHVYVAVIAYNSTIVLVNQINAGADVPMWQTHAIDPTTDRGRYNSLAVLDGKPMVAYYNSTDGNLLFARATVFAPTQAADWVPSIVNAGG